MQFKVSENSLFAILLRSSWWISFAVAAGVIVVARFLIPEAYFIHASSIALPFVIIGAIAVWKQAKVPSSGRVSATVEAVTAMSWRDFSALMEEAFQREGYEVTRTSGAADFKLLKAGRTTLVACKRWKAASHGVEPLRDLDRQRDVDEVHYATYVALGGVTDNARGFARSNNIRLMEGTELAGLLRLPRGVKTKG